MSGVVRWEVGRQRQALGMLQLKTDLSRVYRTVSLCWSCRNEAPSKLVKMRPHLCGIHLVLVFGHYARARLRSSIKMFNRRR